MLQRLSLFLIYWGRRWAKSTGLEDNPFVLAIHKMVLRLGFSSDQSTAHVELFGHNFELANDLSLLPGLLNGTYESHELSFVQNSLKPGMVFVDIGANFGLYSVVAAQGVGPHGLVISFEPVPQTMAFLLKNTASHGQVKCYPFAVGSQQGSLHMEYDSKRPGCARVTDDLGQSGITVPQINLDDFLEEKSYPNPDFVKIDIEGFEESALKGFVRKVKPSTVIMCEFNPRLLEQRGSSPEHFLGYLHKRFKVVSFIDDRTGDLRPINKVEDLRGQAIANLILTTSL